MQDIPDLDDRIAVMKGDGFVHEKGDVSGPLPWPMLIARCDGIPFEGTEGKGDFEGYGLLPTGNAATVADDLERASHCL